MGQRERYGMPMLRMEKLRHAEVKSPGLGTQVTQMWVQLSPKPILLPLHCLLAGMERLAEGYLGAAGRPGLRGSQGGGGGRNQVLRY